MGFRPDRGHGAGKHEAAGSFRMSERCSRAPFRLPLLLPSANAMATCPGQTLLVIIRHQIASSQRVGKLARSDASKCRCANRIHQPKAQARISLGPHRRGLLPGCFRFNRSPVRLNAFIKLLVRRTATPRITLTNRQASDTEIALCPEFSTTSSRSFCPPCGKPWSGHRADFCVGYFNLRGWKQLGEFVERWSGGEGHCCRLLVGMHRPPAEELRAAMGLANRDGEIDNQTALRLKKKLAEEFREQLAIGSPTNEDEACLRRLAARSRPRRSSSSCSCATRCTPSSICSSGPTRSTPSSATWAAAT